MPEVITTNKILRSAITDRIAYKGKHRLWYVWLEADGQYTVSGRVAPPKSNEAVWEVFGHTYENLEVALDHVAWAETRDNGDSA